MSDAYLDLTTPWQQSFDGLTLRGRRAAGEGATLHFLPGTGFCGGVYGPFLRRLMPQFGLFTHDYEGHGESDVPEHFSGINTTLARVREVMRGQGLDGAPMVGIGHSFGAALTVKLAAENPGLFRALILLDPILLPPPIWWWLNRATRKGRHPMAEQTRRRRDRWPSRNEVIERLRGRGIYAGWSEEGLAAFADHATVDRDGERVLRCPKALEAELFEKPVYGWPLFRRIEVPILFLYGRDSYPFLPWSSRMARRRNRLLTVQRIAGGHCFMQQDPQAAADAVSAFLSAAEADRSSS